MRFLHPIAIPPPPSTILHPVLTASTKVQNLEIISKEIFPTFCHGSKTLAGVPCRKWPGLVTAAWVQAISGNNYTFSNYSDALKTLMGLTQLQLNSLSVAKDVGKAFGIFAGLASDRLPTAVILLIGSVEGFVGYGVQSLVAESNPSLTGR